MPHLLKAAPAVLSLLSSQQSKGTDKAVQQQNKFSDMLQSAMSANSPAASSAVGQANIKPEDIKSSANAVLDSIRKKIPTPDTYSSLTAGIANLPQTASNLQTTSDTKKLTAAKDAFTSAVAATTVKPLIEASAQAAQLNVFSENKSLVVSAAPSIQNASAGGWERYRMDALASNKKFGGLMAGLKLPIG